MIEMNQLTLTDYQDIKQRIRSNNNKIAECFVENGYYLKLVKENKMYLEDGYESIWDFAKGEFGYSRSTASRAMEANNIFSIDGNSIYLQTQYKDLCKSVLEEMITLPTEDYELITPDTKIEDIRELKKAERECKEEEQSQIEGQESLLSIMPDVVPESERPKKEEKDIAGVLRELFKPREMKELLNSLVNMDPDSSEMRWWVGDFNQSGNRVEKNMPFFLFFYQLTEGMKIKNVKTGENKVHTYKDFYFMVRAAFHQETVRGTDVWTDAFGEEYEAELRAQKEAEDEKAMIEAEKKLMEKQKAEKTRAIKENQGKSAVKEPEKEVSEQKEGESASALKEIKENSTFENEKEDVDNVNAENETEKVEIETETPEIVTGMVELDEENSVCDIAQITEQAQNYVNDSDMVYEEALTNEEYEEILKGKRRHFISKIIYLTGDKVNFFKDNRNTVIKVNITVKDSICDSEFRVYGFEVLDYGQEE